MVDRGTQVERLIARYALTTVEALSASVFSGLTDSAAERVLTRLLNEERIRSQPLVGRRHFYTLSPSAARVHGVDAERCHFGLGAQAILAHYSIMSFCLLMQPRHERLTRDEYLAKWGHIVGTASAGRSYRSFYYNDITDRERTGVARLAFLVSDMGAHPRRIVRKIKRRVEKWKRLSPRTKQMVDAHLFSVTVLTGFASKAYLLTSALSREKFHSRVVVVPGYDDLLLANGGPKR